MQATNANWLCKIDPATPKVQRLGQPKVGWLGALLLLAMLASGGSCQAQRRRGKQKPAPVVAVPARPVVVCRLGTGPGYGKIHQFTAEFYQPPRLVFTGHRYSPKMGRHVYQLQDALIKNMLLDAKKRKLMALPEPPAGPPDAPMDTLFLMVDGKRRTFIFSAVNCPEPLAAFAQQVRDNVAAILEEQEPAEAPVKP